MPVQQRDLARDRRRLTGWLPDRVPGATGLEIADLAAPQASGFSNDTLLLDVAYARDGVRRRQELVVRIEPSGPGVFPEYDLRAQFRTLELLAPTDVPVPRARWFEPDPEVLGAPFYVMDRVRGRVPPDNPPYHVDGWLVHDTSPAERAAIWWGGIESLARIHRLDWRATGFGFVDRPALGATGLAQDLAYYGRFLEWAARGRPQPTAEAAFEWLRKHAPEGEPDVLLWGDARIGNILFDGTKPAAVLDWEMVSHGSPEADLAWTIFLDRHHSEGIDTPRLPGFPGYDDTVARYESLTGHRVRHLHYYQVWAGFRFAVIMIRIAQQLGEAGLLSPDAACAFETNNTVTRLLAKLLDLAPPGEASGAGRFDTV